MNTSTNAASAIDVAIGEMIDAERDVATSLKRARFALITAEEENRRLRDELRKSDLRWYTEQQLAERMGVSADTLARLRRKKKIPCVKLGPTLFRYSSLDEVAIAQILRLPGLSLVEQDEQPARRRRFS